MANLFQQQRLRTQEKVEGDKNSDPFSNNLTRLIDRQDKLFSHCRRLKYIQLWNEEFRKGTLGDEMLELRDTMVANKVILKEMTAKEHNNGYCFISVRPKPKTKFEEFHKICTKLFHRNLFTEGYYLYEQTGTTPETMGQGFHAHFVMKRNLTYKPSKLKDFAYNSVKKICASQAFDCQHIGEDFRKDKLEYIFGLKTAEGKDLKQLMDVPFREHMQVQLYYER